MGIALADNVKQLLDRPNFAHLATLMEDGSPLSTPVWVGREGDRPRRQGCAARVSGACRWLTSW